MARVRFRVYGKRIVTDIDIGYRFTLDSTIG